MNAGETVDTASFRLKAIAAPQGWNDTKERALERAASKLGLSHRQARRIVNRQVKTIAAHVYFAIEDLYERAVKEAEARVEHERQVSNLLRKELDDAIDCHREGMVPAEEGQSAGGSCTETSREG